MKIIDGITNIVISLLGMFWIIYLFSLLLLKLIPGAIAYESNEKLIILTEYIINHPWYLIIILINIIYLKYSLKKTKIFLRLKKEKRH